MLNSLIIRTPTGVDLEFEFAGLGDRLLAFLIDLLIQVAYILVVVFVLFEAVPDIGNSLAIRSLFFLPVMLYSLLLETFMNGQSLGKQARKIRVVRLDGKQIHFGHLILRWLLRLVDILISQGSVAVLSIVSTRFGQRLGDLAAGTTVVKDKKEQSLEHTLFREVDENYEVSFPQASGMNGEEAETIALLLRELETDRSNYDMMRLTGIARERLCEKLNIQSEEKDIPLLRRLLDDYNHLSSLA